VGDCVLFWRPGETQAIALGFPSETSPAQVTALKLDAGTWVAAGPSTDVMVPTADDRVAIAAQKRAIAAGRVELRPVTRRQVFLDGRAVGGRVRVALA
jgi:hypothetical protein